MSIRTVSAVTLFVIAAVVSHCRGGTVVSGPPTAPTFSFQVPSPPPASADVDAAQVQMAVAAYRNMWNAYLRALAAPDPDSPDLARYAAGIALIALRIGVREVRAQGLKGEGSVALSPRVVEVAPAVSPTRIEIQDCFDDRNARIVRASPGPAPHDTPGGRQLCTATVERTTQGWKVTGFDFDEVGSCG